MKKIALILAFAGFASSLSAAENNQRSYSAPYGLAGCGLGSVIITEKDKDSQMIASVINTYVGFVSSAITSGTSNCNFTNNVAVMEQKVYTQSNLSSLEKEASQGEGYHLVALAQLFGCQELEDVKVFADFNKKNYTDIYVQNQPGLVFESMKKLSLTDGRVSHHCPGLG